MNPQMHPDEQIFYDHFLALVDQETPEQLIERIRKLFLDGYGYPDEAVQFALNQVLVSRSAAEDFPNILNRCLHILINRWQINARRVPWIVDLVDLFEHPPINKIGGLNRSRSVGRLHQLIGAFVDSDQFWTLKRLAQFFARDNARSHHHHDLGSQVLETLMPRYPYLYDHCLVGQSNDYEHQLTVQRLKNEQQTRFEQQLSSYVTHHMRRNALMRRGGHNPQDLDQILGVVENPTLLTGHEVASGLKFYMGKVQGGRSHKELAHQFAIHTESAQTFAQFKEEFYIYVTDSVHTHYGKRHFNAQFAQHLEGFLPDHDYSPVSDLLIVRTCSHALNFLVVDNSGQKNHFTFLDLLGNLGSIFTTGVLLKVVLFCKKAKPCLEKRLSILFNHYSQSKNSDVLWLVKSLENVNLALTTNFGSVSLPLS